MRDAVFLGLQTLSIMVRQGVSDKSTYAYVPSPAVLFAMVSIKFLKSQKRESFTPPLAKMSMSDGALFFIMYVRRVFYQEAKLVLIVFHTGCLICS